jgi:DUF3054 family protein
MKEKIILAFGDLVAILMVAVVGFTSHGETGAAFLPRMAAVYFPLALAWFLLAPWFGLFDVHIARDPRELWRAAWAMLLTAPFAALLRGLILGTPIIPTFAVVLALTSALGMVAWRVLWRWLFRPSIPE